MGSRKMKRNIYIYIVNSKITANYKFNGCLRQGCVTNSHQWVILHIPLFILRINVRTVLVNFVAENTLTRLSYLELFAWLLRFIFSMCVFLFFKSSTSTLNDQYTFYIKILFWLVMFLFINNLSTIFSWFLSQLSSFSALYINTFNKLVGSYVLCGL